MDKWISGLSGCRESHEPRVEAEMKMGFGFSWFGLVVGFETIETVEEGPLDGSGLALSQAQRSSSGREARRKMLRGAGLGC